MDAWVDLYWLPLGAGGWFVRRNGRAYERWSAWRAHRAPADLYHSALMIRADGVTWAVEVGPVWNVPDGDRGVLCVGAVGSSRLGRLRPFRYEVRRWAGGRIPDVAEAVASPVRTTRDPARVARVLAVLEQVPPLVWGRDELGAGDMWNSNSVVAWALARSGHDLAAISPPEGGRAPGWTAGLELARRQAGTCPDGTGRDAALAPPE
jgi:hypothetical protein